MKTIPPGSTVGIIGGGQLGRMLAMAAAQLGYRVHVLDPDVQLPTMPTVLRSQHLPTASMLPRTSSRTSMRRISILLQRVFQFFRLYRR
jgi:phosphoribosylaminoimidazole carboxylase (NCAIR synthetase)